MNWTNEYTEYAVIAVIVIVLEQILRRALCAWGI